MRGKVSIYSDRHRLLDSRVYFTQDRMKAIIAKWLANYPDGFFVQVRPHIQGDTPPKTIRPIPNEPIIRPPAQYNKLPVYDYQKSKNGEGK